MVHTLPPWTSKWRMTTIFGQIDQGELAARLGSINTFDRRGDTVWMDDFETPILKWAVNTTGTNSAVDLVSTYSHSGSQCVKLYADSTDGNYAMIQRRFPLPVTTKIGTEIRFTAPDADADIQIETEIYTGTLRHEYIIKYDHKDKEIDIIPGAGEFTTLATGVSLYSNPRLFNSLKYVTDYSDFSYVRLLLNETSYDISSYSAASSADETVPHILIKIFLSALNGNAVTSYIDDFILTQNEE